MITVTPAEYDRIKALEGCIEVTERYKDATDTWRGRLVLLIQGVIIRKIQR